MNDANAYGHPLDFGHSEGRDGYATKGTYHVLLPDGRTQTVNYHVDDAYSGYIADVSYAGTPHYGPAPHHAPAYDESPKPYVFEYGVADDYSGANFKAAEASDSKAVTGSYSVNLPDGRIQTVTYTADPYGYGGFVADVAYSGEPHYPEYKPAYKPAPYHA